LTPCSATSTHTLSSGSERTCSFAAGGGVSHCAIKHNWGFPAEFLPCVCFHTSPLFLSSIQSVLRKEVNWDEDTFVLDMASDIITIVLVPVGLVLLKRKAPSPCWSNAHLGCWVALSTLGALCQ